MFRKLVVSLMLAVAIGGNFGCDTSSDSESPLAPPAPASPSISQAEKDKAIKEATEATEVWLKVVDDGKYADAWDQTEASFKQADPKDPWVKQTAALRAAVGPVVSRSVSEASFKTHVDKGPDGQYVTLHYDTAFKATPLGVEEVTEMRETDGTWRTLGYYLTLKPPSPTPAK